MKKIIVVLGPTAIGKTSFAIEEAKKKNTEIVSFDSRQFYREMKIGTSVPSKKDLSEVKHHFIHNISIHRNYSIGDYKREATEKIEDIFKYKDFVIMVGGSGMYLDSVIYGLDDFPDVPIEIRKTLKENYEKYGLTYLQNLLKEKDSKYFKMVDVNNYQRLTRALEVCISTGKPFSDFLSNEEREKKLPYDIEKICLIADRDTIYNRINMRVDNMIKEGLLDEVKGLYMHRNLNALQTVGYRELFNFLDGKCNYNVAVEDIKKNTRRYAKRQLTWIRNKYRDIKYIDIHKNR